MTHFVHCSSFGRRVTPHFLSIFFLLFLSCGHLAGALRLRNRVPDLFVTSTDYNGSVIIIGAGAAGLYAAYTLEYLGVTNYTILEAKGDFGGRAQEMDDFIDLPLDVGAEWIHTRPRILQDLILFNNDTVTERTIRFRPRTYRFEVLGRLKIPFGFLAFWLYREWKFRTTTWKSYLAKYYYPYVSRNLHLNTPVAAVDTSNSNNSSHAVVVTTADGREWVADKVIVAVPPTMLQQRNISFTPALPDHKLAAIDEAQCPGGFKLYIEFDKRFYADITLTDVRVQIMYMNAVFRKPTDHNVLVIFGSPGPVTERLTHLSDERLFERIMDDLDRLFWGKASRFYVQHRLFNWANEPYIEGTWTVNSRYDHDTIAQPVDKTVYFAGAYIPSDFSQSTVHGAALSGRRAAQLLLKDAAAD